MIFNRKGKLNVSMRYIFTLLNLVAMLTLVMPLAAQRNAPVNPISKTNFSQKGSTSNLAPVCNTAPIDWTTAADPDDGPAGLYPSVINLSGLGTSITDVKVQLTDVTHTWSSDLEVLLVGPGGQKFVVMADVGGNAGFNVTSTVIIDDAAPTTFPTTNVALSGSYKPTMNGTSTSVLFPAPAPAAPYQLPTSGGVATFASVFASTNPNGNWSLYVRDDANGDPGSIASGWCIDVTTGVIPPTVELASPTFETDEAGLTSNAVLTVERAGDPSAALTVNYSTGGGTATGGAACEIIAANDYLTSTGTVSWMAGDATDKEILIPLCADPLIEGNETFNVTLSMPSGGTLGANTVGVVTIVDSATQYKVIARNEIPGSGTGTGTAPHAPAGIYPYALNVSGLIGPVSTMRVTLFGLSHTFPDDIDILLVGPTGATFVLMGDAGGSADLVNATVTFDDAAGTILPNSTIITSGTYEPANYVTPVTDFPGPAPGGPYMEPGSALTNLGGPTMAATFGGTDPNGVWNLYIRDDAAGDVGGIEGFGLHFAGTTASQVSISGRAIHASGQGIPNQIISVIGGGIEEPVFTRTNSFGYFTFRELDAGETYILSIESNKYMFNNPTQVITAGEDVGGIVFSAGKQ